MPAISKLRQQYHTPYYPYVHYSPKVTTKMSSSASARTLADNLEHASTIPLPDSPVVTSNGRHGLASRPHFKAPTIDVEGIPAGSQIHPALPLLLAFIILMWFWAPILIVGYVAVMGMIMAFGWILGSF